MSPDLQEIEGKALNLSSTERAILAEHLIGSLEGEEDTEAERLWINEAERRYREYKEDKATARPAAQVFKDIDAVRGVLHLGLVSRNERMTLG